MSTHAHEVWDAVTRRGVERPPQVDTVAATIVAFTRGQGCCDTEVIRECFAVYTDDGLLGVIDPMEAELAQRRERRFWQARTDAVHDGATP